MFHIAYYITSATGSLEIHDNQCTVRQLTVWRNMVNVLVLAKKKPKHKEFIKNGTIMQEKIMPEISTVFQIWRRWNRNNLFTLKKEDFEFMATSH
jgi:hypothetical protein